MNRPTARPNAAGRPRWPAKTPSARASDRRLDFPPCRGPQSASRIAPVHTAPRAPRIRPCSPGSSQLPTKDLLGGCYKRARLGVTPNCCRLPAIAESNDRLHSPGHVRSQSAPRRGASNRPAPTTLASRLIEVIPQLRHRRFAQGFETRTAPLHPPLRSVGCDCHHPERSDSKFSRRRVSPTIRPLILRRCRRRRDHIPMQTCAIQPTWAGTQDYAAMSENRLASRPEGWCCFRDEWRALLMAPLADWTQTRGTALAR